MKTEDQNRMNQYSPESGTGHFISDEKENLSCLEKLLDFYRQKDENGISNAEKIEKNCRIIRRVDTTDKNKSYEEADPAGNENAGRSADPASRNLPCGIVAEDGRLIRLGIHIFNEDIYPLQSFEIYLRGCDLSGCLDLSHCRDMLFVDLYHNRISEVRTKDLPSMRIFGVQDNQLTQLDPTQMPACQGIDAGLNRLREIDVSQNPELVELYVNQNELTRIDLSRNPKLKYFYCHGNRISVLDTRSNPLLRHLNAADNPMKSILSLAPQREKALPLELRAGEGGCVGLKFNPVYNAQWKETGEWQQSYYAYPDADHAFAGWFDENDRLFSKEPVCFDDYGSSRILRAEFGRKS